MNNVSGSIVSAEYYADLLENGVVTKSCGVGSLNAKWIQATDGATRLIVEGMSSDYLELMLAVS